MALTVMIVNGKRHLINTESKGSDDLCKDIIDNNSSSQEAIVDFDKVNYEDVSVKNLKDLFLN